MDSNSEIYERMESTVVHRMNRDEVFADNTYDNLLNTFEDYMNSIRPLRIQDWFSKMTIDENDRKIQKDYLFYDTKFFCTYNKPEVGNFIVNLPQIHPIPIVTVMKETSKEFFVGFSSGHLYLLNNNSIEKRFDYKQMNGSIDIIELDGNDVIAVSGCTLRKYHRKIPNEFKEISFETKIVKLIHYSNRWVIITQNGIIFDVVRGVNDLHSITLCELGGPVHKAHLIGYNTSSDECIEPLIVLYRNWFAMVNIGKLLSGNATIMRRFEISGLFDPNEGEGNFMIPSNRFVFFAKKVEKKDSSNYKNEITKVLKLEIEGLNEKLISQFSVIGSIIEMGFYAQYLVVSLTTKRVEIYNACSLMKSHIFILDGFATSTLIVDNVLVCGMNTGYLRNMRIGQQMLCQRCRLNLQKERQRSKTIYICPHLLQKPSRKRKLN